MSGRVRQTSRIEPATGPDPAYTRRVTPSKRKLFYSDYCLYTKRMVDGISAEAYDALVAAAETYRAAVVVRLAGEAGLRTAEITRVTPGGLHESDAAPAVFLLAVPEATDGSAPTDAETPSIDRETTVPRSLASELRRYADSAERGDDEPLRRRLSAARPDDRERDGRARGRPHRRRGPRGRDAA